VTQQLRAVQARKDWRRVMWEIIAGLVIGVGWAVWVMYQISPRSVVTDLAFQSQAKRLQAAAGLPPPAAPQTQEPAAAPIAAPAQIAAPQSAPAAAISESAATAVAPVLPATKVTEPVNADMLKLATEIATPLAKKGSAAKPSAERRPTAEAAPAPRTANKEKRAPTATGAPAPKSQSPASIDKQIHVPTQAERAENEFGKATVLLNQGRVAEAMDGFKSTLQQDGGHAAARQALVGLLLENRRIDEAQQLLQEGLSRSPDRSAYAMLLARIQVERGDLQGAHDLLSKHAGSAANNADYHAFDAALLQRLGRHKEAVSGYQAALRLTPGAGVWWMGMGISLQADNRGTEALDAFGRAKAAGGLSADLLSFVDQRMKQLQ